MFGKMPKNCPQKKHFEKAKTKNPTKTHEDLKFPCGSMSDSCVMMVALASSVPCGAAKAMAKKAAKTMTNFMLIV